MNDSRNMVAVFMSNDDCPGAADRMLDLFCRFQIVRLHHASSEKVVDLLVHTRVEHDVAVGIYHLKDGPGLHARLIRRAFHRKFFGAAAFGKLENVDPQRVPAGNHSRHSPDLIDVCCPDLLFLQRRYQNKREHEKTTCTFHRCAFLDEYRTLGIAIFSAATSVSRPSMRLCMRPTK